MGMDPIESTSKEINKDDILSRDDLYIQILLEKEFGVFGLGKSQKVFGITMMQACDFLQVKAGFASFYFKLLSRFYLN